MDQTIAVQLHETAVSQAWLSALAIVIASYGAFLLPLCMLIIWLRPSAPVDYRRAVLVGFVSAGVAFGLGLILERTLNRPRPFAELGFQSLFPHALDASFRSDHTLVGVALGRGVVVAGGEAWHGAGRMSVGRRSGADRRRNPLSL